MSVLSIAESCCLSAANSWWCALLLRLTPQTQFVLWHLALSEDLSVEAAGRRLGQRRLRGLLLPLAQGCEHCQQGPLSGSSSWLQSRFFSFCRTRQ